MATILAKGPKTALSTNLFVLGDSSDESVNGGWIVEIVDDGSLSVTVIVKGQSLAARRGGSTTYNPLNYRKGHLAGTATDWTMVHADITGTALIFIPAGGMAVALDVTLASGAGSFYLTPVIGSCAF